MTSRQRAPRNGADQAHGGARNPDGTSPSGSGHSFSAGMGSFALARRRNTALPAKLGRPEHWHSNERGKVAPNAPHTAHHAMPRK